MYSASVGLAVGRAQIAKLMAKSLSWQWALPSPGTYPKCSKVDVRTRKPNTLGTFDLSSRRHILRSHNRARGSRTEIRGPMPCWQVCGPAGSWICWHQAPGRRGRRRHGYPGDLGLLTKPSLQARSLGPRPRGCENRSQGANGQDREKSLEVETGNGSRNEGPAFWIFPTLP